MQPSTAAAGWQRVLEDHLELQSPALRHWTATLRRLAPRLRTDPHTPVLAAKLASPANQGNDVERLIAVAMRRGPLPDDHAATALQFRLERPRREPIPQPSETITSSSGIRHEHLRPPGLGTPRGPGIGF